MKRKIISITSISFFSIFLWFYISFTDNYYTTVKIPIVFKDVPNGYVVSNPSVEEITLSLQGKGWELAKLTLGGFREFVISLEGKIGKQSVFLLKQIDKNPWLTSNLSVIEISPRSIEFNIEKIKSKKIPIKPIVEIEYTPGFGQVSDIMVDPDSIIIKGPENLLDKIEFVETKKLVLNDISENVEQHVELNKIQNITIPKDICLISIEVQKIVDKEFNNIPVKVIDIPKGRDLIVIPNNVKIILRGGIKVLGDIQSQDIEVYVSFFHALDDTSGTLVPKANLPDNITLIDITPPTLQYIIKQF
ncbi:MAG: YbbR-like domain-containing protein [Ignavibacteriales bacterium]|nr:YbbR-like domain-containing protein [Ignavibacteriales bacterium]